MSVDSLDDLKRDYYQSQLGYTDLQMVNKSLADLEYEFFLDPPVGGGGAHPNLASHDSMGLATQEELNTHAATPHGGGGAPTTGKYVVLAEDAGLSAEYLFSNLHGSGLLSARDALGLGTDHAGALWIVTGADAPRGAFIQRWSGTSWVQISRAINDFLGPQAVGPSYVEIEGILTPPENPASGLRRLFVDAVDGKVKARTSGGVSVSLEEAGNPGWEVLGQASLVAPANTVPAVTVAARDLLLVIVRIVGYDTADTPALRFNGDTGANYNFRCLTAVAGADGATTVAFVDRVKVSEAFIRLSGVATARQRAWSALIANHAAANKSVSITPATLSSGASVAPTLDIAPTGGWFNALSQITSVQLVTVGTNNLLTGSGLVVMGKNIS